MYVFKDDDVKFLLKYEDLNIFIFLTSLEWRVISHYEITQKNNIPSMLLLPKLMLKYMILL